MEDLQGIGIAVFLSWSDGQAVLNIESGPSMSLANTTFHWHCAALKPSNGRNSVPVNRFPEMPENNFVPIDVSTPVAIVGFTTSGLGVARALARYDIPCWVLYNDSMDTALKSRFVKKIYVHDMRPDLLAKALANIAEIAGKKPVLIPTSDKIVEIISENSNLIRDFVSNYITEKEVIYKYNDKNNIHNICEKFNLYYPKSIYLNTKYFELDRISILKFPCIIKPSRKTDSYIRLFNKAYIVSSIDELEKISDKISEHVDGILVQEFIDGQDSEIFFYLAVINSEGEVVNGFSGRKISSWPPGTGNTAACVPAPEQASNLLALTEKFFTDHDICGLCSLEFKRDRKSGKFYVIEPTVARVDAQSELAVLNGINLPLHYYCLSTNQKLPPMRQGPELGWRDSVAVARLPGHSRRVVREAAKSIRFVDALWRVDDPMPYIGRIYQQLLRVPASLKRRFFDLMRKPAQYKGL